jgi:hypothetical protein
MAVSRARLHKRLEEIFPGSSNQRAKKTTRSAWRSASMPGILSMVLGSILPVD